jgi:hypothetical protein
LPSLPTFTLPGTNRFNPVDIGEATFVSGFDMSSEAAQQAYPPLPRRTHTHTHHTHTHTHMHTRHTHTCTQDTHHRHHYYHHYRMHRNHTSNNNNDPPPSDTSTTATRCAIGAMWSTQHRQEQLVSCVLCSSSRSMHARTLGDGGGGGLSCEGSGGGGGGDSG